MYLIFFPPQFNPETIFEIAQFFGMSRHSAFIGCPGPRFRWKLAEFGGVRIITSRSEVCRAQR